MGVGRVLNRISQRLGINALGSPVFRFTQHAVTQQAREELGVKLD